MIDSAMLAARGVSLRAACVEDAAFERDLFETARGDLALLMGSFPDAARATFLDQQFQFQTVYYARAYPDALRLVVLADGTPIGRLIVDRDSGGWCLVDIALMTEWRGRGLGTLLVQAILDAAVQAEAPTVRLSVALDNKARRLYERLGFVVVEEAIPNAAMEWRPRQCQLNTA